MTAEVDFFATYAEAAYRASYLARVFDTPVRVRAIEEVDPWLVELPANYNASLDVVGRPASETSHSNDDDLESEPEFENYQDDSEDLREEIDEVLEKRLSGVDDGCRGGCLACIPCRRAGASENLSKHELYRQ